MNQKLEKIILALKAKNALPKKMEFTSVGQYTFANVFDELNSPVISDSVACGFDLDPAKALLKGLSEFIEGKAFKFTGAESKPGLLEIANGGTVFLDEVHHLGPEAQAMLLRFIQERKIRRVGGNVEKFVDVRLVFAAKPVLKDLVASDAFLADLMYRMKEIKIDLPRLTDRPEDIEVLCEFFLDKHAPKGESNWGPSFPQHRSQLNTGFVFKIQYGIEFPGQYFNFWKLLLNPFCLGYGVGFLVPLFGLLVGHSGLTQKSPHCWLRNFDFESIVNMLNKSPACPKIGFKSKMRCWQQKIFQ